MFTPLQRRVLDALAEVADEQQVKLFVIGGFVRDLLLKRPSKDIDVLVLGDGPAIAAEAARKFGNPRLSVFKTYGTAMFKYKGVEIEFVGARKESYAPDSRKPSVEPGTLEDDQRRRDFTINTLALSLNRDDREQLLDPFNGLQDLHDGVIRTPLDPRVTFSDDPLRMMRAIRFAARLDFRVDPAALQSIKENRERLAIVSAERVMDEFNKIMLAPRPSNGIKLLDETGLLDLFLPELTALKGVQQIDGIGHKDNFYHSLAVLDGVSARSENLWLRWAALLHDVAKPLTKRFVEGQGWTFHGHNHVGVRVVERVFRRLRLPLNEKLKYVQKLVFLHMRPIVLSEEGVTDSAVRRLLFDAGEDVEDLMLLAEADVTSKNEEKVKRFLANFRIVRQKLKEVEEKDAIRDFQPPVSGEEIMAAFHLPPCRQVGEIKNAIKEAILDGAIANSPAEAREYMFEVAARLNINP
ncbi:MAG: CCA tRNA nucleotidyltransferase [Odoribacteraceae bacterium]|jgi:putative nucleotidyltransferase with HDIG domain|nr:CCA tRNA nucleotidyltransferase [Odoribacteraceae bacterium]